MEANNLSIRERRFPKKLFRRKERGLVTQVLMEVFLLLLRFYRGKGGS